MPASPSPTQAPTAAPAPKPAGQVVDLPSVDATYTLDVQSVDLARGAVAVRERVDVRKRPNQGPLPQLFFTVTTAEYGYFALDAARLNGSAVTPESRHDGFTLVVPLPNGDQWTVEFDYQLALRQTPEDWNGSGLDHGVVRMGYWFPIISTDFSYPSTADPAYTRTATFDVWLPLPPNTPFASTGTEVGQEQLADGRVRHHLQADRVRDFAIAVVPGFRLDTISSQTGVKIELLSPPDMGNGARQSALDAAATTIDRLSQLIGPYPYPVFRMVHVGATLPGGIEFPMVVFLNMQIGNLARLVYHETAHQWLYGLIGTRPQQDPWIDEGGAQFLEGGLASGFTEHPTPPAGGYRFPLDASDAELPSGAGIPGFDAIYRQGQAFYQTVLETMGQDAFWAAMQEIYQRYAFDVAVPWDVLSIWQAHSPGDLRPLFGRTFRYPWIAGLPGPGIRP
jgi:hypothetical protein